MTGRVFKVGELVRVGKGKTTWRIESFWTSNGGIPEGLAQLIAVDGYSHTSVAVDRLTPVEVTQ